MRSESYSSTYGSLIYWRNIFQFAALYKGVMSPVYGQLFINAIVFGVHANTLKHISNDKTDIKSNFVAGFVAGQLLRPQYFSSQRN